MKSPLTVSQRQPSSRGRKIGRSKPVQVPDAGVGRWQRFASPAEKEHLLARRQGRNKKGPLFSTGLKILSLNILLSLSWDCDTQGFLQADLHVTQRIQKTAGCPSTGTQMSTAWHHYGLCCRLMVQNRHLIYRSLWAFLLFLGGRVFRLGTFMELISFLSTKSTSHFGFHGKFQRQM